MARSEAGRLPGGVLATGTPVGLIAVIVVAGVLLGALMRFTNVTEVATRPELFVMYAVIQAAVFLALIFFLDLYEREPLSAVAALVVWGGTVAIIVGLTFNDLVKAGLPEDLNAVFGDAIAAPLVEELAKGSALGVAFAGSAFLARRFGFVEFEGVTDGLVYGAAVGMGFAFTEDINWFLDTAETDGLAEGFALFRQRVDLFGLNMLGHSVLTGLCGAGLGLATWSRGRARVAFGFLGLIAAMVAHGLYNGLVNLVLVERHGFSNTVDYLNGKVSSDLFRSMQETEDLAGRMQAVFGVLLVAFFFATIFLWLQHQRRIIIRELRMEAGLGTLSADQIAGIADYWGRARLIQTCFRSRRVDEWRHLRLLNDELVGLAFCRWRLGRLGGDPAELERRRRRVAAVRR